MDRLPLAILATIGFTALVLLLVTVLFNAPAEDAPGDEHGGEAF